MRQFTAVFRKDGDWWPGWVEELSGANAQERTLDEARESLREAIKDILEVNREIAGEYDGEVRRETLTIDALETRRRSASLGIAPPVW